MLGDIAERARVQTYVAGAARPGPGLAEVCKQALAAAAAGAQDAQELVELCVLDFLARLAAPPIA